VPEKKLAWGYRYEADKFGIAGFIAQPSVAVAPPRVRQCPVQMEGIVHEVRPFGKNVSANSFEIHIVKLHVDESLLVPGDETSARRHIDPEKWKPLIMSFCRFFGMGAEVHPSRLAESDFMRFVRNGTGPQVAAQARAE
jgi:flavin reductase (DIM6/NTAB) family NADH-FMN oxidoreductase RutF